MWRTAKQDSMGYCSSPPSTASMGYCSSTVGLLQPPPATVHPRAPVHPASTSPPPATVQPDLSTGSCSTTPPQATVHLALHRLLFNQPSMGSCSSTPNWLDRRPVPQTAMTSTTTGSCSSNPNRELFIQPQPGTVHPTPQQRSLFIKRQQVRLASVSSSREGIARSVSVNNQGSFARVQ